MEKFWMAVGKGFKKWAEEQKKVAEKKGTKKTKESVAVEFEKAVKKVKPVREKSEVAKRRIKKVSALDRKFQNVMKVLDKQLEDLPPAVNEDAVEKMAFAALRAKLGKVIKYQVPSRGGRIDLSVGGGDIGIELKIATKTNLQRLIGQVHDYVRDFKRVGVVILDAGKVQPAIIRGYMKTLKSLPNVKVIIKKITLKRRRREREVRVRMR